MPEDGGAVPLTEVPPLVFSEVMRDADLAVGVASIGLDQEALAGHEDYWRDVRLRRRSARPPRPGATCSPGCCPASRSPTGWNWPTASCGCAATCAPTRSTSARATSSWSRNDAYLCIVPERGRDAGQVFLPFEEDGGMLSIILSKAFLLADDTSITDPSITRRLR